MNTNELSKTIAHIAVKGKGILAADESTPTMTKRLQSINVESTEEKRRDYREILFTTPNLDDFISGVILYDETIRQQSHDGKAIPEILAQQGIMPGIKVDKGTIPLSFHDNEKITQGIDNLAERLQEYKALGARFAKWRAVLNISNTLPSPTAIHTNAEALARYAAICQQENIVPIVEPELLMDGDHDLERCKAATEITLHNVFHALFRHDVTPEYIILKPSMVINGKDNPNPATVTQVAEATVNVLSRTVPASVPTINFLSGGQSDELATDHLSAINKAAVNSPWQLSFSYGRALQASALNAWAGDNNNKDKVQQALYKRAKLNSAACFGEYTSSMEKQ